MMCPSTCHCVAVIAWTVNHEPILPPVVVPFREISTKLLAATAWNHFGPGLAAGVSLTVPICTAPIRKSVPSTEVETSWASEVGKTAEKNLNHNPTVMAGKIAIWPAAVLKTTVEPDCAAVSVVDAAARVMTGRMFDPMTVSVVPEPETIARIELSELLL